MDGPEVTSTRHELNFAALSPYDFERLCMWLIRRQPVYSNVEHIGAAGRDRGRDVIAHRRVNGRVELVYVQCKRLRSTPGQQVFAAEVAKISEAVARGMIQKPDRILFIVTQHLSGDLRSRVSDVCKRGGYDAEFLGLSELDREVKFDAEILREFFDLSPHDAPAPRSRRVPFETVTPHYLGPVRQGFVNRAAELSLLEGAVRDRTGSSTVLVLEGPSGAGKSRLAEEWAQRHRATYPDGQVVVDFRALRASPAGSVAEALRSILLALGCPSKKVPEDLPDRLGMYRTLTAQRRLMLLLDHATEAAEVRALLPDAPDGVVLVTTNSNMSTLHEHGAVRVRVERLDPDHSRAMLHALVGHEPTSGAETLACQRVLTYCAGLPLALDLCATRIRDEGWGSYEWLAAELEQEETRLGRMGVAPDSLDVVFGTTYAALPENLARAYRLLGLAPRLSTRDQAGAVLGVDGHTATKILSALHARHLVEVAEGSPVELASGSGRVDIGLHDLVRLHARTMALAHDGEESAELVHRIARHAVARARQIDHAISPERLRIDVSWPIDEETVNTIASGDSRDGGGVPSQPSAAPSSGAAAARAFETERAFIVAAQSQALLAGIDPAVCVIADALWPAMYGRGYDRDIAGVFKPAVVAAERMGDHRALCRLRMLLARGLALREDYAGALAQCDMSIGLARAEPDDWLLASALEVKGLLVLELSGPAEALAVFKESRSRFPVDRDRGRAIQDHHIGMCHAMLGHHEDAVSAFTRAKASLESLGDRVLLARTGWRLAEALLALGERDKAGRAAAQAEAHAVSSGEFRAHGRALLVLAELTTEQDVRRSRIETALDSFVAASDDALAAVAADRLRQAGGPALDNGRAEGGPVR